MIGATIISIFTPVKISGTILLAHTGESRTDDIIRSIMANTESQGNE